MECKHICSVAITVADRTASGRALERRKALGEHETHEAKSGLKRDGSRRVQRSGSIRKGAQSGGVAEQLVAAVFVLVSVLALVYFAVLWLIRGP